MENILKSHLANRWLYKMTFTAGRHSQVAKCTRTFWKVTWLLGDYMKWLLQLVDILRLLNVLDVLNWISIQWDCRAIFEKVDHMKITYAHVHHDWQPGDVLWLVPVHTKRGSHRQCLLYTYINVCICIIKYMHIYICIYTYIHIYMYTYLNIFMYTHMYIYIHTYTYIYVYKYIRKRI